jgi:hypothetical protein
MLTKMGWASFWAIFFTNLAGTVVKILRYFRQKRRKIAFLTQNNAKISP